MPECIQTFNILAWLIFYLDGDAFVTSTQDCFKASWGSHKSIHLKAKLLELSPGNEQDATSPASSWLYCLKKGQARTLKMPNFDWTGYFTQF